MKTFNTKSEILDRVRVGLDIKNDSTLAQFLGISPTTLSNWRSRNSIDYDLVFSKCEYLNLNWLLTGKGEMFESENKPPLVIKAESNEGIPLIPINAMAGFATGEAQIMEHECERYIVPMFKEANFLIPVKGSSMIPKYNSGDIVACKALPLKDIFFQWNKVYALDTIQGALVKRIKKGSDNEHILIVSDNPQYEPFELHSSQLYAVSLVIGVIRLE
jgi:phage repressor protein C with HTH and peptisase S24 domain